MADARCDVTTHARFSATRDPALRDRLVRQYDGLAKTLARTYMHAPEAADDLLQVARIGLIKAIDRFDPERDVRFATYAWATMRGELRHHFRDATWAIHVPRRTQNNFLRVRDEAELLTAQFARSPTIQELAAKVDLTEQEVIEAMEVDHAYMMSTLDGVDPRGDVALRRQFSDAVEDHLVLTEAVAALSDRDRRLLRLRFADECTQAQIGQMLGMSQIQVSRTLRSLLDRLRAVLVAGGT